MLEEPLRMKTKNPRPVFPGAIDGRFRHAHHWDGTHGCTAHFHVEPHHALCSHFHEGAGHLISMDDECGFRRDESGTIVAMAG